VVVEPLDLLDGGADTTRLVWRWRPVPTDGRSASDE